MGNANNLPSTSANMMNQAVGAMGQQNAAGGMPIGANPQQQRQQPQNPAANLLTQMNSGASIQQMKQNQQMNSGMFSGANAMNPIPNALAQQRQQQQVKNVRNIFTCFFCF